MAHSRVRLLVLAAVFAAGCKCTGDGTVHVQGDGGTPVVGADAGGFTDGGPLPDAGDGTTSVGVPPGGFVLDDGSGAVGDGVMVDPSGHLVLNSGHLQLDFAWIANANQGTVSRYDTRTGKEVGRYLAVIPRDGLGNPVALTGNQAHSPSRTAVDIYGDVWVANRAPDLDFGSVTKIAGALIDCIDRDGDGQIRTSRDLNDDGVISTHPADGEFIVPTDFNDPLQYDECILFTTQVGTVPNRGVKGRAIAISRGFEGSAGDVWVGLSHERKVIKLSAKTGQQVAVNAQGDMALSLPFGPYGAAVDGQQRLWVVSDGLGSARLALVDTVAGNTVKNIDGQVAVFTNNVAVGNYGIGIDGKDRVWLAGWTGAFAARYEHGPGLSDMPGAWSRFDFHGTVSNLGTSFGRARGIAADDQGYVWMSADFNGATGAAQLIGFDAETGAVKKFDTPLGQVDFIDATSSTTHTSIGVGIDGEGHPWINNHSGNAMRIHRDTGEVLLTPSQPWGLYTYSDFTGYQLRKFTAPRGTYRNTLEGCGPLTRWLELTWTEDTPAGTSIQAFVRVADTPEELAAADRYGPYTSSPVDLEAEGVPRGRYLQLEFVLTSQDQQSSPTLKGFEVKWRCEVGIN
jgi:hypothetical protein